MNDFIWTLIKLHLFHEFILKFLRNNVFTILKRTKIIEKSETRLFTHFETMFLDCINLTWYLFATVRICKLLSESQEWIWIFQCTLKRQFVWLRFWPMNLIIARTFGIYLDFFRCSVKNKMSDLGFTKTFSIMHHVITGANFFR